MDIEELLNDTLEEYLMEVVGDKVEDVAELPNMLKDISYLDNKEELIKAKKILASEVENSSLMIKRCVPLKYNDIVNVLELIYKGKDGGKA